MMLLFNDLEGEDPQDWIDQIGDRIDSVEEKILKLRPLADRGADGERENAVRAIEKLEYEIRDLRTMLIWASILVFAKYKK